MGPLPLNLPPTTVYRCASCLRMRHTILPFTLLLSLALHAQDPLSGLLGSHYFGPPLYENAQDSADYIRFRKGLVPVEPKLPTDTTTVIYRMVWRENQHGGLWTVTRGDGSVIRARPQHHVFIHNEIHLPFRTVDGRRGMVLEHEVPCGMICRSAFYYVEE